MKDYLKRMLGEFDYSYIRDRINATERVHLQERIIDDVIVSGRENLEKVAGEQYLMLSNHLSHMDYLIEPRKIADIIGVSNFPRIVAGKNIDNWLVRRLCHLDIKRCGVFLIDRETISGLNGIIFASFKDVSSKEIKRVLAMDSKRKEDYLGKRARAEYLRFQDNLLVGCFNKGDSFLLYPEGGRRDKESRLKNLKKGFLSPLENSDNDLWIIPAAITYDNPVEKGNYSTLKFLKNHKITRPLYFGLDFSLFLKRVYFEENKGNCYIHFGKPVKKSKIATHNVKRKRRAQLARFCEESLKEVYSVVVGLKN